jgi:protoporphyrin/coproporphyrin ferrochelatase
LKLGVVLFQLGGPDSLESVEPFLYNLFCDPDIIDFPLARIGRRPLARLIASTRARHVARHYQEIGGKSPILENTIRQAEALETVLRRGLDGPCDARVVVAMRYWRPFTAEAIALLERHAPEEVVLLPLYPQYSSTTTGSSLNEWRRRFHANGWNPRVRAIEEFHLDGGYLDAVAETVNRALAGNTAQETAATDFVFSAHGVPAAVVERGDPYQRQIERTVDAIWQRGAWSGRRHLCYQSKVGAAKWLRPSMRQTLQLLAAEARQRVVVVPISFVSDHMETLHEIDIEHRAQARELGIEDFRLAPGLNDSPKFIAALAGLVERAVRLP